MRLFLGCTALLALSVQASSQNTLFRHPWDPAVTSLHSTAGAIGDVDGDGIRDFVVGRQGYRGFTLTNEIEVRSGSTGRVLLTPPHFLPREARVQRAGDVNADGVEDFFIGTYLVSGADGGDLGGLPNPTSLGDLDGDGYPELLTGEPYAQVVRCGGDQFTVSYSELPGTATVYSTRDWSVFWTQDGKSVNGAFGGVTGRLGDLDGDGLEDFAVAAVVHGGAPSDLCLSIGDKYVQAFSSGTGALLWDVPGEPSSITPLGDVDGDGVPDSVFTNPRAAEIQIVSGADGSVSRSISGVLGIGVDTIADRDRDGIRDLLVGGFGSVRILSSRTGAELARFDGDAPGDQFGAAVANLGDVNEDGVPDFVVSAPGATTFSRASLATVLSSKPLRMRSNRSEVSLIQGGSQTLQLDLGPAFAKKQALVLGSRTGNSPATALGGVFLPLVVDGYTRFLLQNPDGGPVVDGYGPLDARGRRTARIEIPAGLPLSLAGSTLFHAALILDVTRPLDPAAGSGFRIVASTEPVPLTFVP